MVVADDAVDAGAAVAPAVAAVGDGAVGPAGLDAGAGVIRLPVVVVAAGWVVASPGLAVATDGVVVESTAPGDAIAERRVLAQPATSTAASTATNLLIVCVLRTVGALLLKP